MSDVVQEGSETVVVDAPRGAADTEVQRASERAVVSYLGIASYGDGELVHVNLVDLSAVGARMVAPAQFDPPAEFILKIPETGACFLTETAWRNGATFGVQFLRPVRD